MYLRRQTCTRPTAGYTLIELVLVMALLCLAVGLAAPSLRDFFQGHQAQNGAEQFVAVAQWARAQAITRGEIYRLNVDAPSHRYWLTVQRGGQFVPPGEEFGSRFDFPDGISVECDFPSHPDGAYVEFEPSGRADEGNLRLTGSDGTVVQLGCQTNTDQFEVYPQGQTVAWGVHHGATEIVVPN